MMVQRLQDFFFHSLPQQGDRVAVEHAEGDSFSRRELAEITEAVVSFFSANGIGKGCRVAVIAPKSADVIAVFLAALQCGAAYVPVDCTAPAERIGKILNDLDPHAVIALPENLPAEFSLVKKNIPSRQGKLCAAFLPGKKHDDDLAYILYTSGSTGTPKGVCITHENAIAFVNWSLATFPLNEKHRFSSIAPFHFDLSVFDLYAAFGCGGTIVLVDEETTKNARALSQLLARKKISVVYATPSLLSLLLNFGKPDTNDFSALELVLFAGEVFPVRHLHELMNKWKSARFFNLYGPTETNVCTWYEVKRPCDEKRTDPYPVGKMCAQLEGKIAEENELLVSGPNVAAGYWKRDDLNETKFVNENEKRWYRTGDRMETDGKGNFIYTGRLDRMIKKRGYRIEPVEIENILLRHPGVLEAAIIPGKDEDGYAFLRAFLVLRAGAETSVIAIKQLCATHVPVYMIPEKITFMQQLPKTSSGKVDYFQLENLP